MRRRSFLSAAFAGALDFANVPVIDTHIHLFDVSRPQGVPWPTKDSPIYKSALPPRFRKLSEPFGVVGAIEIECSPWPEDNQWVLDVAKTNPIIVGTIGDLEPGKPEFRQRFEQLQRNQLFRGIRYGNLWGRDLAARIADRGFVDDLKVLASAGLVLDTANPTPALMHAVVRVSDRVPDLKIVIDHLPELALSENPAQRKDLHELGQRPHIYAKISGIVRRENGRVPLDLAFYRDRLDSIWQDFGADRVLYGSDWPNCNLWAEYPDVFRLAKEFISGKDRASIEKFYWRNSVKAYGWVKRDSSQPG